MQGESPTKAFACFGWRSLVRADLVRRNDNGDWMELQAKMLVLKRVFPEELGSEKGSPMLTFPASHDQFVAHRDCHLMDCLLHRYNNLFIQVAICSGFFVRCHDVRCYKYSRTKVLEPKVH